MCKINNLTLKAVILQKISRQPAFAEFRVAECYTRWQQKLLLRPPVYCSGFITFELKIHSTMLIEIAVFNLESAIAACQAGADRIELCSAPAEGGLTPSGGMIRMARNHVSKPIHVMIRPREGDFCYTDSEFEAMLLDVAQAKAEGIDGIVAGVLNPDGTVDEQRTAKLAEAAAPMNMTFHRAFDMSRNLPQALETIIAAGCSRILTSGGQQTALAGLEMIAELQKQANGRILIMPGSGINPSNALYIARRSHAKEMHLSARCFVNGKMTFRTNALSMDSFGNIPDYEVMMPDSLVIAEMKRLFAQPTD